MINLTDPRTGLVRRQCLDGDRAAVRLAVEASAYSRSYWASMTPAHRARRLLQLANAMNQHGSLGLIKAEVAGTGKPCAEATEELVAAADLFRFFAGATRAQQGPSAGEWIPGHESWVRWEPLGVVGVIVPWNYPLMMTAWRCAPALAAGNTVVIKPAETTPDSAELLAKLADDYLGAGVLTVITGGRGTGQHLVDNPGVDMIAFTGSATAGCDVASRAGVRPVSLELGGNCPVIILPDAPAHTWEALATAATYNAGQSCAAPARVITLASCYERVINELTDSMLTRAAGVDFGPLNNPDQLARYDHLVTGAGIHHSGPVHPPTGEEGGYWRPACVLADLSRSSPTVVQEIFGPVLTVQAVDSLDEAVALANSAPQALAGSVWTERYRAGLSVARRLRAGEVWVNCHLVQTAELPHSGRGQSGNGTDLSTLALAAYQRPKTITCALNGEPE